MMTIQLKNLSEVMGALQQLPEEVVSKGGGPIKRSLRKGGLVVLRRVQANLQQQIGHTKDPEQRASTGLLLKSARITRGKPPTGQKGERYLVRFGRLRYPGRKPESRGPVTTLKTARLLEYGSEKQVARPYIRPAYLSTAAEALNVIERELVAEIQRIARRLARSRKG